MNTCLKGMPFLLLLVATLLGPYYQAYAEEAGSVVRSTIATSPPRIDGDLSWPSEWPLDSALSKYLTYRNEITGEDETHRMEVYVMNDHANLYVALKVLGDDFQSGVDTGSGELCVDVIELYFDDDNDGLIEQDEDIKNFWALEYGDWHYDGEEAWSEDDIKNGVGEASHSSMSGIGDYFYEFEIPLNSGDPQDLAVAAGSTLGIKIIYREMYSEDAEKLWAGEDGWPSAEPRFDGRTYGKLLLSAPIPTPSPTPTATPTPSPAKPEVVAAAAAGVAFTSVTFLTSQAGKATLGGESWQDWLDRLLQARERAEAPVSYVEKDATINPRKRREVFHLAVGILIVGSLLSFMGVKFGLPAKSVFDIFRYIKVLETMPTIEYVVKTPSFLVQAIASASIVLLMGYVARLIVARYLQVVVEYKSWILGILMLSASTVLFKSPYGAPSEMRTPKTTPHHIRGKLSLSFILVAIATSGILYVLYLLGSGGWLGMGIYYGLALAASSSVPQKPLPGYAIYQYNKMLSIGLSITCFVLLFLYLDPITGPIVGVILAVASIAIAGSTRYRQPKGKPTIVEA